MLRTQTKWIAQEMQRNGKRSSPVCFSSNGWYRPLPYPRVRELEIAPSRQSFFESIWGCLLVFPATRPFGTTKPRSIRSYFLLLQIGLWKDTAVSCQNVNCWFQFFRRQVVYKGGWKFASSTRILNFFYIAKLALFQSIKTSILSVLLQKCF